MTLRQLLGIAGSILVFSAAHCEPLNVVVADLTFTRPQNWKWEPPDPKSPAVTRFIVPNELGKLPVDVRFYQAGKEPGAAEAIWKIYFTGDKSTVRIENETIGKRTVTYVLYHGTLTLPGEKPAHDQSFVGVVIPFNDKFMHIRCSGPFTQVEQAMPALRRMVKQAVEEREGELAEK